MNLILPLSRSRRPLVPLHQWFWVQHAINTAISDLSSSLVASTALVSSTLKFNLYVDDALTSTTDFSILFDRTASSFTSLGLSYLAFIDDYLKLQRIDFIDGAQLGTLLDSVRSDTNLISYTPKSLEANAVIKVFTVAA